MLALPPLTFAAFVGWLLLFPMGGIPVPGVEIAYPLVAFLLPHAITLLLIGYCCPAEQFSRLSIFATAFCLGLTVLYPFFPDSAPLLMPLAGVGSAFLTIRSCLFLRQGRNPVLHAGIGLGLGNLILLAGQLIPAAVSLKFIFLALLLLLPLVVARTGSLVVEKNHGLFRYLPFVFVYHLVSGIMYGVIMPAYAQVGVGQGTELFFYIFAVFCGVLLFRLNREYLLALAIILAMLSFTCFLGQSPLTINLCMYAIQAAAGCLDIFILGYLLSFDNLLEAFGIGNGTICLSIFCGHQLAVWIGEPSKALVMVGCLVLTCAVMTLYFLGQGREENSGSFDQQTPLSPVVGGELPLQENLLSDKRMDLARATLSTREWDVFCGVVSGKTFKVVAVELALSESTVKTYMKRIYDKYGVNSKKELLKKVYEC